MLDITPLAETIGAKIQGLDLASPLHPDTVSSIRAALLQYGVLIFPAQKFDEVGHLSFAKKFGVPEVHPTRSEMKKLPEIFVIDTADGAPTARWWHADMTALESPPMGSILQMRVLPDAGGDTEWSNQVAAYEALPRQSQERIDSLWAEHVAWWDAETRNVHPVVRTHPETGRRSLFVNGIFTRRILDMPENEGAKLLEDLCQHGAQDQFTCRHAWTLGDVAFWDNRFTQHRVHDDFGEDRRRIHRVTLLGDRPLPIYEESHQRSRT